jgi:thymidylate kinase
MIVELMGCSGVGKTTLAAAVEQRLKSAGVALANFTNHSSSLSRSVRNAGVAPVSAAVAYTYPEGRQCLQATTTAVLACDVGIFWTLARLAAAARVVGEGLRLNRSGMTASRVILVDEGILTTVQLGFARREAAPRSDVTRFATAIPTGRMIVSVDAPASVVLQRTADRSDRPREWRTRNADDLRRFVESSLTAFRIVANSPHFQGGVIPVVNDQSGPKSIGVIADLVVEKIRGALNA